MESKTPKIVVKSSSIPAHSRGAKSEAHSEVAGAEAAHHSPTIEPKLIAPLFPRSGEPPRRIVMERTKRLYAAQDIDALLRDRGVDYSHYGVNQDHSTALPTFLPLEVFDDVQTDPHLPHVWIALGTVVLVRMLQWEAR